MWHSNRFGSIETLEVAVQSAGIALACPFASSSEFEAATIRAKHAAGIYGPKRHRRLALLAASAIALIILLIGIAS